MKRRYRHERTCPCSILLLLWMEDVVGMEPPTIHWRMIGKAFKVTSIWLRRYATSGRCCYPWIEWRTTMTAISTVKSRWLQRSKTTTKMLMAVLNRVVKLPMLTRRPRFELPLVPRFLPPPPLYPFLPQCDILLLICVLLHA
ncbi:hypothetical protein ANCDUO_26809 [Ancylostoma duodenale]|uniref:Secreted protein n=1 Tax=Ancylostoma duodenale TaxID=51022 RepID=A0A0C2F3R7_9BILA|nr:hypothetical protein ANCDUO_26809 [Ancylostoma duodenale]